MSPPPLYFAAGAAVFAIGLYGLLAHAHLLRKILAANVLATGISLVLIALARRDGGEAPDAVPHALVLTGIVVSVSTTAFSLVLTRRLRERTGHPRLPEEEEEAPR
jgi:multicomponent Na+:H+ antiporter subunit C